MKGQIKSILNNSISIWNKKYLDINDNVGFEMRSILIDIEYNDIDKNDN